MSDNKIEKSYLADLQKIKETIRDNRYKALVVVNSAMIMTYHKIGTIINERKEWGNKYVRRLAEDLIECGKGYSFDNLMKMMQFASIFTEDEILLQPVTKISWSTIIQIVSKSSSKEEMLWYINQAYNNRWSRRIVIEQFKAKAYERKLIEPQVTQIVEKDEQLKQVFKDTLSFGFLGKAEIKDERDLKERLLDNVILFLHELGPGFSLVGREYRLLTPTNKNYYIDLLMYHTKIHSYVVIEVKIGEFQPSDIGQLHFYINAINDLEKTDIDNQTIGILLCKTADSYAVKTTLDGIIAPIGISKYKLLEDLPNYLLKKMKTIK
ncbi:MAG: DUF1016 family protein [Bacilli bacterium]|nr:DUF1016 family protein [Bacilli bacterium]